MKSVILGVFAVLISVSGHGDSHPPFTGEDLAGRPCAYFPGGGFGPFDYTQRHAYREQLRIVERRHFTSDVEFLRRGSTTTLPYGDLAYTLRAWPNHHRALNAISRYQLRMKRENKAIGIPAECWFKRAINYNPKDATTYMLYAMHLHKEGELEQAEKVYKKALEIAPNDIQLHYNYGLLLADLEQFEAARKHAKIAYERAYPLPGLKERLEKAGHWP